MKFISKIEGIEFNNKEILRMSQKFNLCQDIVKLLFARGIDNEDKIDKYLNSGVSSLYNPFLLKNMQEVVDKIKYYIMLKKRILIMGDYDTDGISASAILFKYFKSIGVDTNVFLPNRVVDGYGLTIDSLDKVKSMYSPDLIITVDC